MNRNEYIKAIIDYEMRLSTQQRISIAEEALSRKLINSTKEYLDILKNPTHAYNLCIHFRILDNEKES